jgi:hypothetical protein
MSLLDVGQEDILIFLEEAVLDEDGNTRTRPSKVGTPTKARLQPLGQSGTSSRRQEQDNEGYESERVYSMRLPRSWPYGEIGTQSRIQWRGEYWALFGPVNRYTSSSMTAHLTYTIKRF